jgi:hypothetical protein
MRSQSVSSATLARAWQAAMAAWSVYGPSAPPAPYARSSGEPAAHEHPVPARAVLVEQQDRLSRGTDPRARARRLQLHQSDETVYLGLRREQPGEDAPESKRLLDQLRPDQVVAGGRRVALVEDQVDHLEHGGEAISELLALGDLEGNPRHQERALCAHDPLRDRPLGHQVGAGDLLCGQAAEQTQRERHPRLG